MLFLINMKNSDRTSRRRGPKNWAFLRKATAGISIGLFLCLSLTSCASSYDYDDENTLFVYNWGEYLDPTIIEDFTEETGIEVIYDEYETNEVMYPKIISGAAQYDLVCPSDYMIEKMISEDLLLPLDKSKLPNLKNIDPAYLKMSESFDPGNKYSLPHTFGTVGILYNKSMVDPEDSFDTWSILWDEKYKDDILMQDSVRDAMMVALKLLGYSMNTTDPNELREAQQLLMKQKPLVQAYVVDQVRDKMIGNEAAIGVIYSGEAIYTQEENPDLEYVIPKEGTNFWLDSWVILKGTKHEENAHKFLNFLMEPEMGWRNFDYITYSTPNIGGRALIEEEEIRNSEIAFPHLEDYYGLETYSYMGDDYERQMNRLWREVKSF